MNGRTPKALLIAFFDEYLVDRDVPPLRAGALIDVVGAAGVPASATRSTLDRMERCGLLTRERRGRDVRFSLSEEGRSVVRRASEKLRRPNPFLSHEGYDWTLVTFTVPEGQRTLRARLRSVLATAGFARLRDGLWIAPGEVGIAASIESLRSELPPGAVTAFFAEEHAGFAMADSVLAAWNIERVRDQHLAFLKAWSDPPPKEEVINPLGDLTTLVSDWITLLHADPLLPGRFLGPDWPARLSYERYAAWRRSLEASASVQFAALAGLASAASGTSVP